MLAEKEPMTTLVVEPDAPRPPSVPAATLLTKDV
jgi:hypothetical protein